MRNQFVKMISSALCVVALAACSAGPVSTQPSAEVVQELAEAPKLPLLSYIDAGDIWVKTLPAGDAKRLTEDGDNWSPRWSSSGRWISFLKNEVPPQLWVMQADGGNAQPLGASIGDVAYQWSPLEDKIAVASGGGVAIYRLETNGDIRFETQIFASDDAAECACGPVLISEVAWSPSGDQFAFTQWGQPTTGQAEYDRANDGLWVADLTGNPTVQLVQSGIPETGQIILSGWSGDAKAVIYWESPILSASILSDGVPLYSVAASGGTPVPLAEAVVVLDDAVASQPVGTEIAIVAGSGREMWQNKSLNIANIVEGEASILSPTDQAVNAPRWSPNGAQIAYTGMQAVEGVSGGDDAYAALNERRIWIFDGDTQEAQPLSDSATGREEALQWVDAQSLLVARMDAEGATTLWQVRIDGSVADQQVAEISPTPDWLGYYGAVDWSPYFALWQLPIAPQSTITTEETSAITAGITSTEETTATMPMRIPRQTPEPIRIQKPDVTATPVP